MKADTMRMDEQTREMEDPFQERLGATDDAMRREFARLRERVLVLEDEKRELRAFTALAAHELLEPLVMADAYAQMVLDRLEDDRDIASVEDLLALSRGLSRTRILVESLLHETSMPSRLLDTRSVDLNKVLRETLELLDPEVVARKAKISVKRLPVVHGDEALLSGLLKNLLINALKYGPRTGGHVEIEAERQGDEWCISIASEGATISAAERLSIFQPFRRGFGERRARGAGLGLSICQRIVERHGGRIDVAASPNGAGNVFFFTLPV
jgi:light-regulated signal transduction histidine kinase (bacteriophytochrome)